MEKIGFYCLKTKEGNLHPYFMTSTDDKEAAKFCIDYFSKVVEEVKDSQEKQNMIESLRECTFVRVGWCNLFTSKVEEDFNVLLDLRDFMVEVKKDVN